MQKSNVVKLVLVGCLCAWWFAAACSTQQPAAPTEVQIDPDQLVMFEPLPAVMESPGQPLTEEKIALGRMLYYDSRLSRTGKVSCNSCHDLANYGVDSQPVSDGIEGKTGDRNSPTVYNAAGHFVQFWDGRAPHVEEQAKGPVMNPIEMAMGSEKDVVKTISGIPEYVAAFKKAFPEDKQPVSLDNVGKAIGAFERKLVTPSRWDRFLTGDKTALTSAEKAGFNKFMEVGCQACHMGAYVGGSIYQKMGLAKPWIQTTDLGRFKVTGREEDKMLFKVPSLRNIEKTAPYYHNGGVATLEEAVKDMGEYQLGRRLSDSDVQSIITWLRTLTGEIPKEYIKEPQLPGTGTPPRT